MVDGLPRDKIGFIIQARMSSERLPRKVLLPLPFLGQEVVLQHILSALRKRIGHIIVATSELSANDAIEELCNSEKVECFRGDENDVLSRFVHLQEKYQFDYVFRFTADNPIIDMDLMSQMFEEFRLSGKDYCYTDGLPIGMNFEAFKGDALLRSIKHVSNDSHKEHVTPILRLHQDFTKFSYSFNTEVEARVTLDEPSDYGMLSLLFTYGQKHKLKGLKLLESVARDHPWIFDINNQIEQKEPDS